MLVFLLCEVYLKTLSILIKIVDINLKASVAFGFLARNPT